MLTLLLLPHEVRRREVQRGWDGLMEGWELGERLVAEEDYAGAEEDYAPGAEEGFAVDCLLLEEDYWEAAAG